MLLMILAVLFVLWCGEQLHQAGARQNEVLIVV
jgi:hypothetical protein